MTAPNFFDAGSPFLSHPLLTAERTAREVDFVLSRLKLQPGARIVDVGCGPGRHAIELARRGFDAVGIDPSAAMIAAARERARAASVSPEFREVRGDCFDDAQPFDAAICLGTTLGQESAAGSNIGLVGRVAAALRADGAFVVEVPQRSWTLAHLKRSERLGEGPRATTVTRAYDAHTKTIEEQFDTPAGEFLLRYRVFDEPELTALLREAGIRVEAAFGDYAGAALRPESPFVVVIGRR